MHRRWGNLDRIDESVGAQCAGELAGLLQQGLLYLVTLLWTLRISFPAFGDALNFLVCWVVEDLLT